MSDTSQGDGWWQANDLKWYPPQAVIDQLPPPPPSVPAPGPAASSSPSAVSNVPAGGIRRVTTPQWVEVGALVLSVVSLLMSWASAGILSVSGLNTQDGKIVGVAVLVVAGLLAWRVFGRNAANATLVIIAWLAILGATVAEIVHLTTSHPSVDGISFNVSVGTGLYLGAIAAVAGCLGSIQDLRQRASAPLVLAVSQSNNYVEVSPVASRASRFPKMTTIRWIQTGAVVAGFIGLSLKFVNIYSVVGIQLIQGKLLGVGFVITALVISWRINTGSKLSGFALIICWIIVFAYGIFASISLSEFGVDTLDIGLYVDLTAAAVGLVTALVEVFRRSPSA